MTEAFKQGFMDKMAELKKEAGKFVTPRRVPKLELSKIRLPESGKSRTESRVAPVAARKLPVSEKALANPIFGKKLADKASVLQSSELVSPEAAELATHFWNDVAFPLKEEHGTLVRRPNLSDVSVVKMPESEGPEVEGMFDLAYPDLVYLRRPVPGINDPAFMSQFGRMNHELGHRWNDVFTPGSDEPVPAINYRELDMWRKALRSGLLKDGLNAVEVQAVIKEIQSRLYADSVFKSGKYPDAYEYMKWLDEQPAGRYLDEYGNLETWYTWPTKRPKAPTSDDVLALEKAKDAAWEKYFDSIGEPEEIRRPLKYEAQEAEKLYSKAVKENYAANKVRTFEDGEYLKDLVKNLWAVGPVAAAGLSENEDKAGD